MSRVQKPFVSAVIPVFNSEAGLGALVEELIQGMKREYKAEIVLVNDASGDRSEEVCIRLYEKYPHEIKVISLARNAGEYNAVMAGLKYASGDYAVTLDDDGQNPPSQIFVLMEALLSGPYDVVYGTYKQKKHPGWRNAASKLHNAAACIFLQKPPRLYLSSFKAIKRSLLNEVIKDDTSYPLPDALILRAARNIGQVFVDHEPRKSGKSGYSFRKLLLLSLRMLPFQPFRRGEKGRPQFVIRKTWGIEKERAE